MSTVRDRSYNSLVPTKNLTVPVVQNISKAASSSVGSLVYDKNTGELTIFGLQGTIIPVSAGTSNLALDPLATGESVVYNGTGPNLETKGVVGAGTIVLTPTATDLTLSVATSTYTAGTDISIVGNTISNTNSQIPYTFSDKLSELANVVSNDGLLTLTAGPSNTIVISGTSTDPILTGNYQPGTGVTIVGNTISIPGGSPTVLTLTASNSTMTVDNSVPTNPVVYGNYQSGTGISIVGNVINSAVVTQVLSGDATIVIGGTASNPTVSGGYVAGAQVSIVGNTISLTGPFYTSLTAANNTILVTGTSQFPILAGNMQAGTDISIVGNTISKVPFITSVTAADITVVVGGTATNPTIIGNYQPGTNIGIMANVISYTSGVDTVTAGDSTILIGGTSSDPTVFGNYQAGTNITITGNTIDRTGSVFNAGYDYAFSGVVVSTLPGPGGVAAPAAPRFQVFNDGFGQFLINTSSPTAPPRLGSTGFLVPEGCYIENVNFILSPYTTATTLTLSMYINYSFLPSVSTQVVTPLATDQISSFPLGFYCPGGSVINPILTSSADTYFPVNLSFKKSYVQFPNTMLPPPAPSNVTYTSYGAGGLSSFLITYSTTNDPLIYGARVSMDVGLVPPALWTDPSSVKVNESEIDAFYGDTGNSCGFTMQLAAATTYSMSVWFINGNDPPDMSATPYQTTFTTSA
jgi:hypothetical protein